MHGDTRTAKGSDHKWISLDKEDRAVQWAKELRCTPADLQAAVKTVGNSPVAVREFLARRRVSEK